MKTHMLETLIKSGLILEKGHVCSITKNGHENQAKRQL